MSTMNSNQRLFVACFVTATLTFAAIGSSAIQASDCGCETVCDCDPACGAEPACGLEPQCGAEPLCAVEPQCGCETACTCEPACGCDMGCNGNLSCDGEVKRCESGGFLGRMKPNKCGPIYQALDAVACTVGTLANGTRNHLNSLHVQRCSHTKSSCDCTGCAHATTMHAPAASHSHAIQSQPMLNHAPAPSTPIEVLPDAPQPLRSAPASRDLGPLPTPTPMPSHEPISKPNRPGALFDSLTNPFEDDSVQRVTKRRVAPATFESGTNDRDEYADYFRR